MKKYLGFLLCVMASCVFASVTPQKVLSNSEQLIIVTTPGWNAVSGELQRYQRQSVKDTWQPYGKPIQVVVGKHGMGWGVRFVDSKSADAIIKHEGDGRTPVGVYAIGPTFGFSDKSQSKTQYFPLNDTSVCVDDVKSIYYNQLIDTRNITQKDWNSGEQMRQVPQYQFGALVDYNPTPAIHGAGSCIFMHIWKGPTAGTAGCIAMDEANMKESLAWMDAAKHPMIAILPKQAYRSVKTQWQLPQAI